MRRLIICLGAFVLFIAPSVCSADVINGVAFAGGPANPTITIFGSGFGTAPTPTSVGYPGFTGYDYGDNLYIEDHSLTHGFSAGRGQAVVLRDYIGLVLLTYTDTLISYQLGSDYSQYYYPQGIFALAPGDTFTVVTDATYTGTVSYVTPEPATILAVGTGFIPLLVFATRRLTE